MHVRRSLLGLLALLLPLAACDTNDPEPTFSPNDVAGTYDFVEFRFDPQAAAIADADLLTRLEEDQTFLNLIATRQGGQFQLQYRFAEELPSIINGSFTVSRTQVALTVGEAYRALLSELLLDPTITLQRESETTLVLDRQKTVNLEAYDPEQYGGAGLTSVQGRLVVRLEQRAPEAR